MQGLLEKIVKHFDNTSQEVIESNWTKYSNNKIGPTIDEYFSFVRQYLFFDTGQKKFNINLSNTINPKEASGFLLSQNNI